MRRLGLVAAAVLVFATPAPAARSDCTVAAKPVFGASPLQVTFAATCASSLYQWSFGDNEPGEGQTVQHVYGPGVWQPTLTTDAGTQQLVPVTAVSLTLSGPAHARYAQWVTLHAAVTPSLPVTVRGRPVVGGKIRFRVLGTAPYVAFARGVRSEPLQIQVTPTLDVRIARTTTVGQPVRVVATLHPASAGTVHVAVDGRTTRIVPAGAPRVARVVVTTSPRPGWDAVRASASVSVVQPVLSVGTSGRSVLQLQSALAALHYLAPPRSSTFSSALTDSIYAFQKVNGLPRTGVADAATWRSLAHPVLPRPRSGGSGVHIEVDKARQVLFVVRDGAIAQIVPVSTAGLPGKFTPVGRFAVFRKVVGFDPSPLGTLYDPSYFVGGYAIHGNPSVPPYPASHGCIRVPMWAAPILFAEMPDGTPVDVY
jgi:lipoprotein-anchoring transpeptidase ErfK/SrfK